MVKNIIDSIIMFALDYKNVVKSLNDKQKEAIVKSCEWLCELSYQERLKIYIPGENAINDKRRWTASELGVVLTLKQFEILFKDIPRISELIKATLNNLDVHDHEVQLSVIKQLRLSNQESKILQIKLL